MLGSPCFPLARPILGLHHLPGFVRKLSQVNVEMPAVPQTAETTLRHDEELALPLSQRVGNVMFVAFLGLGYICVSAGLIAYNKFLMHTDRFPFAVPLVFIHACFCSSCAFMLYMCVPSLFPSLSDPEKKVAIDKDVILKGALPIAVMFSGQLALSNTAYLHSSVAFLQMMKEANLALVYAMSLAAGLEFFKWRSFYILTAVLGATLLTIHGELNFSWMGFTIQGASQLFECFKIVLQAMLLSAAGCKLDALTYVMLVMPLCALVLGCALFVLIFVYPNEHLQTPAWHDLVLWWPHLLVNACIAFTLNVVIALFIKHSSAVAFILAGMVKDAMIVLSGVFILNEIVSGLQGVGFALQLGLILVYSLTQRFPDKFEHGLLFGLASLLFPGYYTMPVKAGAHAQEKDYGAFEDGSRGERGGLAAPAR